LVPVLGGTGRPFAPQIPIGCCGTVANPTTDLLAEIPKFKAILPVVGNFTPAAPEINPSKILDFNRNVAIKFPFSQ
jgi:hypothetical protein